MYASYAVPSGEITCTIACDNDVILVYELNDIISGSGVIPSPAREAGLKVGDIIVGIDGKKPKDSPFIKSGTFDTTLQIDVVRAASGNKSEQHTFFVTPHFSTDEERYLIGITYIDAFMSLSSTVQTITFSYPEDNIFAATGHSSEVPTADNVVHYLNSADVKGRDEGGIIAIPVETIGKTDFTNRYGAFGTWLKTTGSKLPIAEKDEVKRGKVTILSSFEGGSVMEYEAFVTGTYRIDYRDVICLIVTDEKIVSAGGIAKGMSGSPILQNGKIIGALSNTDDNGYVSYATYACDMAHEIYINKDKLSIIKEAG